MKINSNALRNFIAEVATNNEIETEDVVKYMHQAKIQIRENEIKNRRKVDSLIANLINMLSTNKDSTAGFNLNTLTIDVSDLDVNLFLHTLKTKHQGLNVIVNASMESIKDFRINSNIMFNSEADVRAARGKTVDLLVELGDVDIPSVRILTGFNSYRAPKLTLVIKK